MSNPAIPDIISIVGSAYLQPIADLLEKLLKRPVSVHGPAGAGSHENGYSAAIIVLLMALLESYAARVRFVRRAEPIAGNIGTPDLIRWYFPSLPTERELVEAFLCRNIIAHNHVWHLDVSNFAGVGSPTLATPRELGFQTNKHYEQVVDLPSRKTKILGLNVNPIEVDRADVRKVFDVVWRTLRFMSAQNYGDTPFATFTAIGFRGKRWKFGDLLQEITDEGET